MTNAFSRPEQTPEPWPITPGADGALPGDLPLTMPRKTARSATVVIMKRDKPKKITFYEVRSPGEDTVQCKIETDNEWILRTGVALHHGRVVVGSQILARIVAKQTPSHHPDRIFVDHADRDPCNDTRRNLHWVTPAFNSFNTKRAGNKTGYFGVHKEGNRFTVQFQCGSHRWYNNDKTAARVYDLLCTLAYGDQLEKTPDLLNNLDQDAHVSLADTQPDGVKVYKVDRVFVLIYDCKVEGSYTSLDDAKRAARSLVSELEAKKAQKEREWKEKAKSFTVTRNKDGIAMIQCKARATDKKPAENVEVLLDDKDWIELHARSAKVSMKGGSSALVYTGGKIALLSRWLCALSGPDVVDHINRNPLDNRRSNLAIRDRSANSQNSRTGDRLYFGVQWDFRRSLWLVKATVKGQDRAVLKHYDQVDEAVKLYDLTALQQHGPNALINYPEKLAEYLEELDSETTQSRVQDFLKKPSQTKLSDFLGVSSYTKYGHWRARVGSKQVKSYTKPTKGYEVRAAIAFDLWRLKMVSSDMVVNFEHLRPCYQHWLPGLSKETEDDLIEKAYNLLGGDAFDPSKEDPPPSPSPPIAGPSRAPIDAVDSSSALAGSSNNPIDVSDVPSPIPGSCSAPFHVSDASSVSPPGSPRPSAVALGKRKARD